MDKMSKNDKIAEVVVQIVENGIVAEVIVTLEEYLKWLKKQQAMDATKTEYGVICDAVIGERK